jgi:hypothetical protein
MIREGDRFYRINSHKTYNICDLVGRFFDANAVDQEDLRSLYTTYAEMKQTTFEEASKDSIGAVQEFFAAKFAVMERAIQENITKDETHFAKTIEKVKQIAIQFEYPGVVENWFERFVACLSFTSPRFA